MKKGVIFLLLVSVFSLKVKAQTGIGTITPHASAKLDVTSSDKGFLPPRVALTASNSASPINNPANGLMVFNTATAGTSPNEVVPGYYYWDGSGLKWVSLSTTVGNVQNQGVFRSTSNTNGNTVVSSWNSRFNNIAAGDLTVTSNTSFALSNGIYKLEWALPYQQANTYNLMVLQEFRTGAWGSFLSDNGYAAVGNGGNTDWGGGTFAADIVDCTTGTRTFRLFNLDGSRGLYYGATFIITKLNPAITTSTTADNLGSHIATKNISLNGYHFSNDGGNEGIRIDNAGNVGIGNSAPTQALDVTGTGKFSISIINSGSRTYMGKDGGNMHWLASIDGTETNNLAYGFETNGTSIQTHRWNTGGTEKMRLNASGNLGIGNTNPSNKLHVQSSDATTVYIESTASDNNGMLILNANTNQNWSSNWHEFVYFRNQGNNIGGILGSNGGNMISYTTSSDYRLKTDLKGFNGLDLVNKMKTYDYAWKRDSSRMYGFMAHELQEVLPYIVTGIKDAVDVNGKIIPQSVDYSKLTPILVKAIQEQDIKIKEQEGKITKLNKDNLALEQRIINLEMLLKKYINQD
jgi:hypothetical protein